MKTRFEVPEVLTPRLRLRALGLADLDAYAAICADAEVMRYIGTGGPVGRDVGWPGCELGWTLARAAWGQGYAHEASLAERLGATNQGPVDFLGGQALVFRHPPAGA